MLRHTLGVFFFVLAITAVMPMLVAVIILTAAFVGIEVRAQRAAQRSAQRPSEPKPRVKEFIIEEVE